MTTKDVWKSEDYGMNQPYKSKIKSVEDKVFKIDSVKNSAQWTWSLKKYSNDQMKCNSKVGETIRNLMTPTCTYPKMPQETINMDKECNKLINKPNGMELFMWHKR